MIEAALMMGTPANRRSCRKRRPPDRSGRGRPGNDLIVGVRRNPEEAAPQCAERRARQVLTQPSAPRVPNEELEAAQRCVARLKLMPDANLALISVPGDLPPPRLTRRCGAGLHVMIFCDNVPVDDRSGL